MLLRIALFELRYQLRNPVFWVSAALFFLLGFGSSASANVTLGTPGSVHENAPYAIVFGLALLTVFYLFVITSFVANAIIRDDITGFAPMIRATHITRGQLLGGRFLGGTLIALLGFIAVPLGIGLGAMMPWVDPETVGPGGIMTYAWPYLIIAVPNILLACSFLFALATLTRSMLASYIGVLVFVMGYTIVTGVLASMPEYQEALARFEPLGIGAVIEATRYWTADDMNTRLISLKGNLLFNRVFVLVLAAAVGALTWWRFSLTERAPSKRRLRKIAKQERKADRERAIQPVTGGASVRPHHGWQSSAAQLWLRLMTELIQVLKSPGLIVLLLLLVIFTGLTLFFAQTMYGTDSYPLTANIVTTLVQGTGLFTLIVAVFYGGELVWRERDTRFHEIVGSTPTAPWIMFLPKIVAIFAVLLLMAVAGMATGIVYQIMKGAQSIDLGMYVFSYVLPQSVDMLLIAVLAVFAQVISPNKYIGWGLMLAWFVAGIFLSNLGYTNILYRYGAGPGEPLSDMNGAGNFWIGAWWARFYWLAFGTILLVVTHWLWPRGTVTAVGPRLRAAKNHVTPVTLGFVTFSVIAMVGSGYVIDRNISVLNIYRTSDETERRMADYERKYLRYEDLPRPVVTDVAFDVEIFPDDRRMDVTGTYVLRNETDELIRDVHVRQNDVTVDFKRLKLDGAKLVLHDEPNEYRIFRFANPLAPGATARLNFNSQVWRRGFANGAPQTDVVDNGTFVNNFTFAPVIGMDRSGLLSDRTERRRQGLPDELRPPKLEDTGAQIDNYVGSDWVNSRITVSTSADQTPIAPGKRLSDITKGGRRTAVFESSAPILNFFSIQSARYELAQATKDGVDLSVYYDAKHAWNVPTMLKAMALSLDYYKRNFGPYQFDYARVIEFPGYSSFAQAFAGTMPYSESIGFAADVRDADKIDYVTYVTAHEVAHQYWAHQVVGADMQGGTMLSETLAQYSALMVMQDLYGRDKIRRFLKYELDNYLGNRKGEVVEELPLYRVENQPYIHYRKGSLVMYLLQERLGEVAVNRALSRFVERYRFQGAPYPRSVDLLAEITKEARSDEQRALVADLFERITLYDLKALDAETKRNPDSTWATTLEVEAGKFHANGQGAETQADIDERIEVGLFTMRPGDGTFDKADVIAIERRPIRSGKQRITLTSRRKPAYAGIDPYNFYIDRDSDDNIVAVN